MRFSEREEGEEASVKQEEKENNPRCRKKKAYIRILPNQSK